MQKKKRQIDKDSYIIGGMKLYVFEMKFVIQCMRAYAVKHVQT